MRGSTRFRRGSGWLALSLVAFATPGARAEAEASGALTASELARLANGELVTRPVEERRGRFDLVGGTSWQVIDARPDVVWQALLDTPRYPRMLPRVVEARLVDSAGDQRTVYVRQGTSFVQTKYYLKLKYDESRGDVRFALDDTRPHDVDAAWGFYSIRPYKGGRTLLTYGIMADLGGGLVQFVVRGVVHEWMLKTPWMIKRFVEGSGRWIYK
jgi:hypothetical protein